MRKTMTDDDKIAGAIWSAAYKTLANAAPIEDSPQAKLSAALALLNAVRVSLHDAGFEIVKTGSSTHA